MNDTIEWTDLGDGLQAWVVNGRPILVRDLEANDAGEDRKYFRHEKMTERVEGLLAWRIGAVFIDARTQAVTTMARVHQVDYPQIDRLPMEYEKDNRDIGDFCQLAGLIGYSATYRLRQPWEGHPRGTFMIWSSGYGKRPGALAAIEQRDLERILSMTLAMLERRSS